MTTIAYKNGVMAADSRCTDEDHMHVTAVQKIFRLPNGALFGGAGDTDDRALRLLLGRAKTRKELPTADQIAACKVDGDSILVLPNGRVFMIECSYENGWEGGILEVRDKIAAVGSGSKYAYAAMDLGHAAIDAVRTACKRDTQSALPVQFEPLERKKK